jgi:uncharacterized damage-inducible protein DinB
MNTIALLGSVEDVLRQALALLDSLEAGRYSEIAGPPHSASIGQHYRHVLDHFLCLAEGLQNGQIDYDRRSRDRELETDLSAARAATSELLLRFTSLDSRALSARYKVLYSVGYSDDEAQQIETTLGREVAFCVSHAIHHFAIIKLVCAHFDLRLPDVFGVAPSTLKYRAALASA